MASTEIVSHTTVPFAAAGADNFTLPNFDTSLGALTGVSITFSYSYTAIFDVMNETTFTLNYYGLTASAPLALNGPGGSMLATTVDAGPISGSLPPGFQGGQFGSITASGSGVLTMNVPSSDFSLFAAPPAGASDSYSVALDAAVFGGTVDPGVAYSDIGTLGLTGTTTVTYSYAPAGAAGVPEPAAWALMLCGFGLAGAVLRRRTEVAA